MPPDSMQNSIGKNIQSDVSLKALNSFAVDTTASSYTEINSIQQLRDIHDRQDLHPLTNKKLLILGDGSNILFTSNVFEGLVLHINLKGISVTDEKPDSVIVQAMAGENWHGFVGWCLQQDYGGLENLSLIPGSVGASPVQNIGAYGVELKDVVHEIEAFDMDSGEIRVFNRDECRFAYRDSLFKQAKNRSAQKGQWIILSVSFRLTRARHQLHLDYGAVRQTLADHNIMEPTIRDVGGAVEEIRKNRLPDPAILPNAGSFFKNPVIDQARYRQLVDQFPQIVGYELEDGKIKLAAGWLIEACGWKGKRQGGCSVHPQHALVLVNDGQASGAEILTLADAIRADVRQRFGVELQPEVSII